MYLGGTGGQKIYYVKRTPDDDCKKGGKHKLMLALYKKISFVVHMYDNSLCKQVCKYTLAV